MIEKNLLEFGKNIFKPEKYYDYDDIEYKRIRNVRNFFDLSIDEDYYKPIITKGAFNNNWEIRAKIYQSKSILMLSGHY